MKQKKPAKLSLISESAPLLSLASTELSQIDSSILPTPIVPAAAALEKGVVNKSGQKLVLRREKKERGGKTVVIVSGFQGNPQAREELARTLRKKLGCGGTVEQGEIIIQGDQPAAVAQALIGLGHQVRGVLD